MSTTTDGLTRPRRRPRRSALQRTLDAVIGGVLRSPLHGIVSGRLLLITVTGRRTGARYTYPVAYVEDGGVLLVGTTATWRRNLRDGDSVTVRRRGHDHLARAGVVTDEEEAAVLYRTILRRNSVHGRYVGIRSGADGTPDRQDLRRALARGAAVVRLRPDETGGTA